METLDYHAIIRSRCKELGLEYQYKNDLNGVSYRYSFLRRLTLIEQQTLPEYDCVTTATGELIPMTWAINLYYYNELWYAGAVYHEGGWGPGDFVKSFDSFEAAFACVVDHQMNWQGPPVRLKK